jgi:hypothetical protein
MTGVRSEAIPQGYSNPVQHQIEGEASASRVDAVRAALHEVQRRQRVAQLAAIDEVERQAPDLALAICGPLRRLWILTRIVACARKLGQQKTLASESGSFETLRICSEANA